MAFPRPGDEPPAGARVRKLGRFSTREIECSDRLPVVDVLRGARRVLAHELREVQGDSLDGPIVRSRTTGISRHDAIAKSNDSVGQTAVISPNVGEYAFSQSDILEKRQRQMRARGVQLFLEAHLAHVGDSRLAILPGSH